MGGTGEVVEFDTSGLVWVVVVISVAPACKLLFPGVAEVACGCGTRVVAGMTGTKEAKVRPSKLDVASASDASMEVVVDGAEARLGSPAPHVDSAIGIVVELSTIFVVEVNVDSPSLGDVNMWGVLTALAAVVEAEVEPVVLLVVSDLVSSLIGLDLSDGTIGKMSTTSEALACTNV